MIREGGGLSAASIYGGSAQAFLSLLSDKMVCVIFGIRN